MKIYQPLILIAFLLITLSCSEDEVQTVDDNPEIIEDVISCNATEIFANESSNAVCFENIDYVRKVYTNNIPNHEYGPWQGPNAIQGQDFEYSMCLYPELAEIITEIKEDPNSQSCGAGIIFGVSNQGINYSPFARLYWVNPDTQEENLNWHVEADYTLNMDLNGGHVNSVSRYHYHNIPTDYFDNDLEINGAEHSPILGYAADGFPIYYKYLYKEGNTNITEFKSGYSLKSGNRPGNGISAPNGSFNGEYVEDYEYTGSELDECGGRFAITPEYPNGTYYYVLTDNWPYIPRCLKGKYIDNSFQVSPGCPQSTAFEDCSTIEVIANSNIFINLKKDLDSKLLYKIEQIDFENVFRTSEITQLSIFNTNGALAYSSHINYESKDQISISSGVYYVQINYSSGQITKKLTI